MLDTQQPLPLLATRDFVLFPKMVAPVFAGRDRSVRALEHAYQGGGMLIMALQSASAGDEPEADDIARVATLAKVVQFVRLTDGSVKALVEGQSRVVVEGFDQLFPSFMVRYRLLKGKRPRHHSHLRALVDAVNREFAAYVMSSLDLPEEAETALDAVTNPDQVADVVASYLMISVDRKQELLEGEDVQARLLRLLEIVIQENEFLDIEQDISQRVHENMSRHQRQAFLRERLRILREELGEEEEELGEQAAYAKMLREKNLPLQTAGALEKEIRRLAELQPFSAEIAVAKTYLDQALGLPWGMLSGAGEPDVSAVSRILDETHYGLRDVKDRIVEYLAVTKLRGGAPPNTTLCFVGPPGVGKTSVAMAIAKGLGRPLQRISLGGVRDEAEIRGHRRTYVGAMPGRIIDAIKRAGVDDPVIVLDEIDKMTTDWRGDPAAALMEVLDPVQNHAFRDTYLELDYDLSKILFLATANYEEDIPETLHDRLEVLRLPGYTDREKEEISRRYLIPRIVGDDGLSEVGDVIGPTALRAIVRCYTREAGVRELARAIEKIYRKLAREKLEGRALPHRLTPRTLEKYLGSPVFLRARLEREPQVGVSVGLAYTGAGGDVLRIECVVAPGKGDFHITGQLGEIMQESITAAWGYLKTAIVRDALLNAVWNTSVGRAYLAEGLGNDESLVGEQVEIEERSPFEEPDQPGGASCRTQSDHDLLNALEIRVHIPEGGVPKEGPSAGIAVAVALLSALTFFPVAPHTALSGEITLTGQVLPVGGLKEKLLAALREGVKTVILPEEVRAHVAELPAELKRGLQFVYVNSFSEVLPHVLLAENKEEE
ncbi:MAG: endopeptidase La [Actinobacteria bacterium]|nr:endopeptidase La [Actinomycetota bacterium]